MSALAESAESAEAGDRDKGIDRVSIGRGRREIKEETGSASAGSAEEGDREKRRQETEIKK